MDSSELRALLNRQLQEAAARRRSQRVSSDKSVPAAERIASLPAAIDEQAELTQAAALVADADEDPELRAQVLDRMATAIGKDETQLDRTLALLVDSAQPTPVRRAAMRVLQQAGFASRLFQAKRAAYMAALRQLVDDPDAQLREHAIGALALHKDEFVQRRLLEGLESPDRALTEPERAIQLLGHDVHAEHFPVVRRLARHAPNQNVKQEAVRLLAADPESRQLLADLLANQDESPEIRSLSAVGLRSLAPEQFEQRAKQIVMDNSEDDGIRAACMSVLANLPDQRRLRADSEFQKRLERFTAESPASEVARSAARLLVRRDKSEDPTA